MSSGDSHENTIARGAGLVLVGTVLSTGIGFLIRTFLIRELPTAAYGLFALALSTAGALSTVAALGLRQGVARTVSRCETDSQVRDVTLTAITSTLVVSLLFSGTLVVFAGSLANSIFQEGRLTPFLQIIGALIPGMTIQAVVIATFRGKKRVYERIMLRSLVSPVARLILIGVAVFFGYGAFGAVVAWTVGVVLSAMLGLHYLYRRTTTFKITTFNPCYRSLLKFSLPLMVSSAMWTAVQQADNLLLGYYKTSVDVGIYDGAFLLARLLLIVLGSFGFLFMPIFSELEAAGELNRMNKVYNSVTEWATLLVLPLYVAMLLVPEAILFTLFKESYIPGTIPLMVVASGFFFHVLSGSCGDALVALGRTRLVMAGNIGAGALNVLLNLALIPRFGIVGAAAASAGAYVLFNLFYLLWLYRETGILPFSRSFLKPMIMSTTTIGTVWLLTNRMGEFNALSLASILALTYFLHALVVVRTKRMTPGDEQLLMKLEAKFGIDIQDSLEIIR
jgi:O-antigen/teichoic acid export membrane protein